jgi:hypothetical protein
MELLVWMESNLSLTLLIVSGVTLPGVLIFLLVQLDRRPSHEEFRALETRLMRLSAAVELLTDTTESGFKSAFAEIERLGGAPTRTSARAGLQTRIMQAVKNGHSVRDIAQNEGISEGEVQLRLGLYQKAAASSAPLPEDVARAMSATASLSSTRSQ